MNHPDFGDCDLFTVLSGYNSLPDLYTGAARSTYWQRILQHRAEHIGSVCVTTVYKGHLGFPKTRVSLMRLREPHIHLGQAVDQPAQ